MAGHTVRCAYLIYHAGEAQRNKAFIKLFQTEGEARGIRFLLVDSGKYQKMPLPDFVLNRTRDFLVSQWYEQRDVPVFHSSFLTETGNDKWKTLEFFQRKLPSAITDGGFFPQTVVVKEGQKFFAGWFEEQGWQEGMTDLVVKTVDGHGGNEVCLLESADSESLGRITGQFPGRRLIVQQRVDSDSKDVRVYILGGEIYQAMLRQGMGDFRSNFSLGGSAKPCHLSRGHKELVGLFLQALRKERMGIFGLDFILTREGEFVFNEMEEMVGCRMLYQYAGRNIVGDFVAWLRSCQEIW